ncbi:transporter [Rhodotorula toruloides]|uniref:Transporter n=1 Tax=Rhodotorula toruloides TaxID=5286 RepID=A0A511KIH1_RHOTO|nr:transporter [Rhodotorula toruloides]
MSLLDRPSLSTASGISSKQRDSSAHTLAFDSDDPSFDSDHILTSTPLKQTTERGRREQERDDEVGLHASDTESVGDLDEWDIERGAQKGLVNGSHLSFARRSLLEFSSSTRTTLAPSFGSRDVRIQANGILRSDELYAPSPSTGSSTLVDREEDFRRWKGGREEEVTMPGARSAANGRYEDEADGSEDEHETVLPPGSEDDSSSSPRPRRSRVGDLASYIDARLSASVSAQPTPGKTPRRQRRDPTTPAAPGAFPSSPRKSASTFRPFASHPSYGAPSLRSSTNAPSTETPSSTGSSQIHDAFKRLITGPDGVLAHSAERRAVLEANVTVPSPARNEPPTPHPAGYYAFVPSSSLPLEKKPSRWERQLRHDAEGDQLDTPSRAARPADLGGVLKHLGSVQQEGGFFEKERPRDRVQEVRHTDDRSYAEREVQLQEANAGRSAIDFAMARSFARDEEAAALERTQLSVPAPPRNDFRASTNVRFADPIHRLSPMSPSTSSSGRSRSSPSPRISPRTAHAAPPLLRRQSTTPPSSPPPQAPFVRQAPDSPLLPPLPPPLPPASPEPPPVQRSLRGSSYRMRRSVSFDEPPLAPAFPDNPLFSPPRPGHRQDWQRPASSTPPRGKTASPPRPMGTPPDRPDLSLSLRRRNRRDEHAAEDVSLGESRADLSADATVQNLVSQLAAAVHALTTSQSASEAPASGLDERGLPLPRGPAEGERELRSELERRKKEGAVRRIELEEQLRDIERRGEADEAHRISMLRELAETYEIEHELGYKVDELKRTIEGMGQIVGDQVAQAVDRSLLQDSRRRTQWLAVAFCVQFALFVLILRFTNARTASLLQNVYYDPFYPTLYHVPSDTLAYSLSEPYLSVDTLAAFSPYPRPPSFSPVASVSAGFQRAANVLQAVLPSWPTSQKTYTSWSEGILVPS